MPKSPTISEIAKLAGVSKTTVSLILNHREHEGRFSEKTVQKINAIIKEQNYHPSFMARSLSTGKTKCLGIICGGIFKPLFSALMDAADARGYRLTFFLTNWNLEKEAECVEMAISKTVDGIILYGHTLENAKYESERLQKSSIPTVVLNGNENSLFPTVLDDFTPGMRSAIATFAATGHKHVALVHKPPLSGKLEPYLAQCEEFGVSPIELRFNGGEDDPKAIDAISREIAESKAEGVIIEDDRRCMRIAQRLSEMGMNIPQDLSAACVCNRDWFELSSPRIDILAYDDAKMAELAVDALANMIKGEKPPMRQLSKSYFIKRGGIIDREKDRNSEMRNSK